MSAVYRIQQFFHAARASIWPDEIGRELPARYLSPEALDLFEAMPSYDRQHALSVVRELRARGHTEPDLLVAALLHDAGKTVGQEDALRLWQRVAIVLLRAFGPGLLDRIAEDRPHSWRRPFFVQQHHAAIGAELAQGAGCSQHAVALIRHHEDPASQVKDPDLAALQSADNTS